MKIYILHHPEAYFHNGKPFYKVGTTQFLDGVINKQNKFHPVDHKLVCYFDTGGFYDWTLSKKLEKHLKDYRIPNTPVEDGFYYQFDPSIIEDFLTSNEINFDRYDTMEDFCKQMLKKCYAETSEGIKWLVLGC